MLLPIVLLLASAGPAQQTDKTTAVSKKAAAIEQLATVGQTQDVIVDSAPNRFVNPGHNRRLPGTPLYDKGIIVPKDRCLANHSCEPVGCLFITAYVFSDGENPELKYITACPNLDTPYQTKRAHREGLGAGQNRLKRTNWHRLFVRKP